MKSTDRILATRYARAYDALSKDASQAADAYEALRAAASQLMQARSYMQDPAVATTEKQAFVQKLFGTESQVSAFLTTLLAAKRYYLLDVCAAEVHHLLDKRRGILRANVQSAFELTDAQKKKTQEVLSELTGKTVLAQFDVKMDLLGGLCVRIDDTLIDGSLKRRFEKLQEELLK